MIDINAPILPYKSMGGIKLYSTLDELNDILSGNNVTSTILHNEWIKYDINNLLELFFNIKNKKLFKITTLDEYRRKLFVKICCLSSISW